MFVNGDLINKHGVIMGIGMRGHVSNHLIFGGLSGDAQNCFFTLQRVAKTDNAIINHEILGTVYVYIYIYIYYIQFSDRPPGSWRDG